MSVYNILKEWGIKNYREINEQAVKEITLGASILATGGGGDPEIGLLWALRLIEEGKPIILVDPHDIPDDTLVTIVGCLGAPVVLTEKPPNGQELYWCLEKLSRYLNKDIQAIVPSEAGGVNTTIPMAVAGAVGIPVIDADGMGRAFPELQMTSFYINGINPTPIASASEKGHVCIADASNGLMAEQIIRNVAMAYGGISWIAGYPMSGKQLIRSGILRSVTLAWELGKAVYDCRAQNREPLHDILKLTNGYLGFKGKVVDINREFGAEKTKGFSTGRITMEGIDEFKNSVAEIDFQNEWLTLYVDGEIKCMTPDLISIIDPELGEPIRTDIVKYGYRGQVLMIPAHDRMRTKKGIETFGPKYFGYDLEYYPIELQRKIKN